LSRPPSRAPDEATKGLERRDVDAAEADNDAAKGLLANRITLPANAEFKGYEGDRPRPPGDARAKGAQRRGASGL
jgi:hypothetical protein